MVRRTRLQIPALTLSSLAILVAGCNETSSSQDEDCGELSSKLVPSCGALLGVTAQEPTAEALDAAEASMGRSFDMVYRFHSLDDPIPDEADQAAVDDGKLLHVSIDSAELDAVASSSGTWAAIAAGQFDAQIRKQARGIAAVKSPVFVTFEHEVDQPQRAALGSTADFIAAWRHMHEVYAAAGATNAVWVWVFLGWAPSFDRAAQLWPGDDYVDWISWDVYNQSGCRGGQVDPALYTSFRFDIELVYNWVHDVGPAIGMDPNKPMMISEAGSVLYPDDPEKTAEWYAEIPDVLEDYPQVKAVSLWDHTGHVVCDYRLGLNDEVLSTVAEMGQDPWLNQL